MLRAISTVLSFSNVFYFIKQTIDIVEIAFLVWHFPKDLWCRLWRPKMSRTIILNSATVCLHLGRWRDQVSSAYCRGASSPVQRCFLAPLKVNSPTLNPAFFCSVVGREHAAAEFFCCDWHCMDSLNTQRCDTGWDTFSCTHVGHHLQNDLLLLKTKCR